LEGVEVKTLDGKLLGKEPLQGVLKFLDRLLYLGAQGLEVLACFPGGGVGLRGRLLRTRHQHQAEKT
jgi:hypothetical protein